MCGTRGLLDLEKASLCLWPSHFQEANPLAVANKNGSSAVTYM